MDHAITRLGLLAFADRGLRRYRTETVSLAGKSRTQVANARDARQPEG
jgi:hypothetical protein